MNSFRKALDDARVYLFDGAYGTLLQSRGLPAGQSAELYGLERPEVIRSAHADYREAGADILTTNTFQASGPKLEGRADVRPLNRAMAEIAREAAGDRCFVAGSVGPTGLFVEPLGELTFLELVDIFKEQIAGLVDGGVDFIKIETVFDLAECKAAVVAVREVCDLPVLACMTFEEGLSLTGTTPEIFARTMLNLGVEAIGTNCSAGPDEMMNTARTFQSTADIPFHVQPNAGLPELEGGETVFRLGPDRFADKAGEFVELGCKFVGGCCGTGPDHIAALRKRVGDRDWLMPSLAAGAGLTLTTRSQAVYVGQGFRSVVIGERINPTGKKQLTADLQEGRLDEAFRLADEQLDLGATVLDVNVGAPMVDETETLPRLVRTLVERYQAPLSIDSSDPEAVRKSLVICPGSPLVNSISGEEGRMERLGPLCRKYGSPFILLPLEGGELPVSGSERIRIIESLLQRAMDEGIPKRLILVDVLALAVSSKPEAAKACFETIRHCREILGLPTVMGLSNISFGLPARDLVNSTFLSMAMAHGLSAFIANPSSVRLREARAASEVLLGLDENAASFISNYADWKPGEISAAPSRSRETGPASVSSLKDAVIKGAKDKIVDLIRKELEEGAEPFALVNEEMIPGIMEVGDRYERKEYFLPQLMLSAETMKIGFAHLQPLLEDEADADAKSRVVMATVEGDIHDIGKNIVSLMLENHGFAVIDLGRDVSAADIVDAAKREKAGVIGLSALMTTTMVRMEEVVELVRKENLSVRVMVGGAVVTQAWADSIGAHGYAQDAVGAVRTAKTLCEQVKSR